MIRALAWKPVCARIIDVNSRARSTFDASSAPGVKVPRPATPGLPIAGDARCRALLVVVLPHLKQPGGVVERGELHRRQVQGLPVAVEAGDRAVGAHREALQRARGRPSWLDSDTLDGLARPVSGVLLSAVPKSSVIVCGEVTPAVRRVGDPDVLRVRPT